jgi:hypothetical protein
VVLLASTLVDPQRQRDALTMFFHLQESMINLGKTKVIIFNFSKKSLSDSHFYFKGEEVEITIAYTYLGVQFSQPRFS